jgi:hypothetical protein
VNPTGCSHSLNPGHTSGEVSGIGDTQNKASCPPLNTQTNGRRSPVTCARISVYKHSATKEKYELLLEVAGT